MNDGAEPDTEVALPSVRDFSDAVDTAFEVQVHAHSAVEMTLEEVDQPAARPGWESFSLIFSGPDEPIPQAIYPLRHPALGSFPLFLVPILSVGGGRRFEAVFNRPQA